MHGHEAAVDMDPFAAGSDEIQHHLLLVGDLAADPNVPAPVSATAPGPLLNDAM
jgi:hypothetical protein